MAPAGLWHGLICGTGFQPVPVRQEETGVTRAFSPRAWPRKKEARERRSSDEGRTPMGKYAGSARKGDVAEGTER